LWPGLPDGASVTPGRAIGGAGWPRPLVFLCALLGGHPGLAAPVARAMSPEDWDSFAELVIQRHRVAPAAAEALAGGDYGVPEPVFAAIAAEARANAFAVLAQKTESLRLAAELEAIGVQAVWLKGWPLAEQLYHATGGRHSGDIDILVPVERRVAAARVLTESGYVPADVHALRGRLLEQPVVGAECKDVQYVNPATGLVVELHWRTGHMPHWTELDDLGEAPERLPGVPGPVPIRVPGPLGQLVYLSAHGQGHLFGRLKWLLDIARLAEQRGPARLAEDLRRAEAAKAGRVVRLALHLAWRVFAVEVPDEVRSLPARQARWVDEILTEIADPQAAPGEIKARLGFYRWHLRMAETPLQVLGVFRFGLWRRLRLGLAGLGRRAKGTPA